LIASERKRDKYSSAATRNTDSSKKGGRKKDHYFAGVPDEESDAAFSTLPATKEKKKSHAVQRLAEREKKEVQSLEKRKNRKEEITAEKIGVKKSTEGVACLRAATGGRKR